MTYNYWRKMKVKLDVRLGKETRALIICFRNHLKLLNERKQIRSDKTSVFGYSLKVYRLVKVAENIEKALAELNRRRVIVSTLRKQIMIAIDQRDDASDELEVLSW